MLTVLLWFAYTSYRRATWYSKSKTKLLCFLSENLKKFSQINFFFFFIKFGLSIKSWKLVPQPPPPPQMGIWDFSKNELSIKFHEPPPLQMGIWDFSKNELSIKLHKPPHPHPPEMGILDFSKSELSIKFHETPPPHKWEF